MADPTLNPNHISIGLERLLTQFHDQPNMEGMNRSYLIQVQELETVFFSLMVERYVLTAEGAQLDGIGRVVGEARLGRTDTDYRTAIIGRTVRNKAHSRIEDILALFVLILPTYTFTLIEGPGPAAFSVEIVGALELVVDPSPEVVNAQLKEGKGAGIRGTLIWSEKEQSETFTFADGDVPQADTARGYADDPPSTIGGFYSGAL